MGKYPSGTQVEVRLRWKESNEIAHCYVLASVTSTLYKQPERCKIAKDILDKLEDMFRGQVILVSTIFLS
ncbi:hypothetical protein PVK06_043141 [Gossypium arboreum]|uniref:Uncharacterized protein n=1 Tax=Gossypium arboreum TaxID=29729 RepID=A0ABR0MMY4_GOSAR|nr:hypothetical protein PVK06_043141 [Gossypium arboreum]